MYCFTHGLPTIHTGSWDPNTKEPECGVNACRDLPAKWMSEILARGACARFDHNNLPIRRDWIVMQTDECDLCSQERSRRCRVLYKNKPYAVGVLNHEEDKFADAPLISQFNEPKYFTSIVRAQQYAIRTKRMLLWAVAEDRPLHPDHTSLEEDELNRKREEWLQYHDQKTNGTMGLLPLIKGMPLRITETHNTYKDKGLFKNRRCTLYGWKLHTDDLLQVENLTEPALKLAHLPEMLFLRIPNASWIWSPELGPGIIGITPVITHWFLDKANQEVRVKRRGFMVASDFSGTAHSFAGDTLKAALVDCLK